EFSAATLALVGEDGQVVGVKCARVDEKRRPIEGTEFILRADLVLAAIGFSGPLLDTYIAQAGDALDLDGRTNVKANTEDYKTSMKKVFAAGDVRKGQSLVVWAIREGRQAARAVDEFLTGSSDLPR
ncbi:MAG: FAD-dependent oxidoreductase, partial [Roseibium sp.]|uniref:FAD-dependent oxidoreductase n=1 Tax=Roseibium sp. TaxID=1936156 RepID=UPI00260D9878